MVAQPELERDAPGLPLLLTEAEFEGFHARTARPLWAYLRRIGGDEALADDILQESYVKFLGHVTPGSDEREMRGFLYRIATNLLRDRWRREQRERLGLASLLHFWSDESRSTTPLRMDLDAALGRLKTQDRALLWLAYVEGYEHREIAKILDLAEKSVRVLLFRAKKKMAQFLGHLEAQREVKS
jgi:RNA polymerase sigma-70 factor (ECF subfamily)